MGNASLRAQQHLPVSTTPPNASDIAEVEALAFGTPILEPDLYVVCRDGRVVLAVGEAIQRLRVLLDLQPARVGIVLEPFLQDGELRERVEHKA